jgi:hypothetical protein
MLFVEWTHADLHSGTDQAWMPGLVALACDASIFLLDDEPALTERKP